MSETERALWQTLVELDAAVKAIRGPGPKPDLARLFARLDELARALPKDTAPDLRHFLHQKSYEKARLWLEGRYDEIARGGCRG